MSKTVKVTIHKTTTDLQELQIAALSQLGFEGFEQKENELDAFIQIGLFNEELLQHCLNKHELNYTIEIIEEQNWNALWESNFEPVQVANFVAIRANFHPPSSNVQYEIVITPKMSFGTGHHATTYMMVEQMQSIPFKNASVFDFGTGTGILAILAEKLGANAVTAIDNDDWSIDNALENINTNQSQKISIYKADVPPKEVEFDIILANINKHIILQHLSSLCSCLKNKGVLLLSGLLAEDEKDILEYTLQLGLRHHTTTSKEQWIAMLFTH